MSIRGVTFDLDGTLANTLPICYAVFRSVLLEHTGKAYSDAEIHSMFGPCEKGLIQRHAPDWEPAYEMFLREYRAEHASCTSPFPGIVHLLNFLEERQILVAVVTGKGPESAAISLEALGLSERFEIVEAGTPEGAIKSESLRRVLAHWKINAETLVHVGDAANDIRSAHEVGAWSVAACWAPTANRQRLDA